MTTKILFLVSFLMGTLASAAIENFNELIEDTTREQQATLHEISTGERLNSYLSKQKTLENLTPSDVISFEGFDLKVYN